MFDALNAVTNWEILGGKLGVSSAELERIKEDEKKAINRLKATIGEWHKNQKVACWEDIVRALEDPAVGHRRLAHQIAVSVGIRKS